MRIGLYGGSFNPVHAGHVGLARKAVELLKLDRLVVLPANVSPFKVDAVGNPTNVEYPHRLELLKSAFAVLPNAEIDERELHRGGISYTIDTVKEIAAEHPDAKLFFLIGEDSVEGLPRWKNYEELKNLVEFAVFPRTNESSTEIRRFSRSTAVLGETAIEKLKAAKGLLVGVGGVGSWCAEALVRTGLGSITLVDDDKIADSNINRQCPALSSTIGRSKVKVMAERLLAINPACRVETRAIRFTEWSAEYEGFDVVIDAIDSVDSKAALILGASKRGIPLVSSMGAALRTDPTQVRATRFDKVEGDGLARALRNRFRKIEAFPKAFTAIWSTECPMKAEVRGSLMTVTATFGMCLAAEAIKILTKE